MSRVLARQPAAANESVTKPAQLPRRPLPRAAVLDSHSADIPASVHDVLASTGRPLDAHARAVMEPRFGYDFSHVRVHTDAAAANSAQQVNALAYTVGGDIAFRAGAYQPHSRHGQALIAHELTHVVQQRAGQRSHLSAAAPAAMEHEARRATATFDGSRQSIGVAAAAGPMLARSEQAPALSSESTAVIDVQGTLDEIEGWQQGVADWASDSNVLAKIAAFIPFFFLELLRRTVQLGNILFGVTELQSVADILFDDEKSAWEKTKAAVWGVIVVAMSALMIEGVAAQIGKWITGLSKVGWIAAVLEWGSKFIDQAFALAKEYIPGLRWLWVNGKLVARWMSRQATRIAATETWKRMVEVGLTPVSWKSLSGVADELMQGVRGRLEQVALETEGSIAESVTRSTTPDVEASWQQRTQDRALDFNQDPVPELSVSEAAPTPVDVEPADVMSHMHDPVDLAKAKSKPRKPPGFNFDTTVGGSASPGRDLKAGGLKDLQATAYAPTRRRPRSYLTSYLQRYGLTFGAEGEAARLVFDGPLRNAYARAMRMGSGEVHHAIELQVLDYYPGVFTAEELNAFANMRGILKVPINPGGPTGDQLHRSLINPELERAYEALDDLIEAAGYQPGHADYNALVRNYLVALRRTIDEKYGMHFLWPRPTTAAIVGSGAALVGGAVSQDGAPHQ
jgi:hypothetical protein